MTRCPWPCSHSMHSHPRPRRHPPPPPPPSPSPPLHNLPSWHISLRLDCRPPLDPAYYNLKDVRSNGEPSSMLAEHGLDTTTRIDTDTDTDPDTDTKSSTWLPQGPTKQGFLLLPNQPKHHQRAKYPPAIAAHRGSLCLVWTDFNGTTFFAATTPASHGQTFGPSTRFPYHGREGIPALANLNGVLHAVIVSESTGHMLHFVYDADETLSWVQQHNALPPDCVAGHETRHPALTAFHNKLFLAYITADATLRYLIWDIRSEAWTHPGAVSRSASPPPQANSSAKFRGAPALFVINGALHLLCESATDEGEIVGYRYDFGETGWSWSPSDDVSEGKAARGVSAASYGGNAYLGFVEHDSIYIAAHRDGQPWREPERVGADDVKGRFAPRVAVMNGRVHCVFSGKWKGDIRWFSRPVLGYDLRTWMGAVGDETLLSGMTVPGTHDSCARSNVPFVRTQYLSISQQLAMGIRFLDLRLRRHDDGKLYCYHGGIPIGLPKILSFAEVMEQVWDFIGPEAGKRTTETVLISINNDDNSQAQKEHPQIFYNTVKKMIESTPAYADGSSRWCTEPVTAKLGDVRGKAVLLRRYRGDPEVEPTERMGLDLEEWLDDNPDFTIVTPTGVKVRLQDKWKYAKRSGLNELVTSKQNYVQRMMQMATGEIASEDDEPDKTWFINFCSAVGDPVEHGEVAEAKWIAVGAHRNLHFFGRWIEGMNVRTRNYLRGLASGKKRLGVVNLDYPELPEDSDLVARLIETNFG